MALAGLSVATIFGIFFDSKVYDMIVSFLGALVLLAIVNLFRRGSVR